MHIVLVHIHVRPDAIEPFLQATIDNARHSLQEPGVARFDVLQSVEDPARITLVEVYRHPDDVARHKETEHYARWTGAVAGWLAEPRTRSVYRNVVPDDSSWASGS
jgi:(4S)-4-hydroxy-5-phosphonooxypentane-2,3-dione isomerase